MEASTERARARLAVTPSLSGEILQGDARSTPFEDESFDCIVTSPPYYANRTYGDDDREIGTGDLQAYFDNMRQCAAEWLRISKPTGVLWLNIFDTAAGSGGAGGDYNRSGRKDGQPLYRQGEVDRPGPQWLNVPHRVVELFVGEGWLYRHCIIWNKERLRPESLNHVRRPGISHEYIFMLAKNRTYRFDPEALVERGSVWTFPPARKGNHLAPFPMELPLRCIAPTTIAGDWVLDPFAGTGTTLDAASYLNRNSVGLDIYLTDRQ